MVIYFNQATDKVVMVSLAHHDMVGVNPQA